MNGIAYGYYMWYSIPTGGCFKDFSLDDFRENTTDGFDYIYTYFQCGM